MSVILQRARESGKCPPSLLSEEYVQNDDGFDDAFLKMLDDNGTTRGLLQLFSGFPFSVYFNAVFRFPPALYIGFVLRPEPEVAAYFATIKEVS
jgi:hypothetical protein